MLHTHSRLAHTLFEYIYQTPIYYYYIIWYTIALVFFFLLLLLLLLLWWVSLLSVLLLSLNIVLLIWITIIIVIIIINSFLPLFYLLLLDAYNYCSQILTWVQITTMLHQQRIFPRYYCWGGIVRTWYCSTQHRTALTNSDLTAVRKRLQTLVLNERESPSSEISYVAVRTAWPDNRTWYYRIP